MRTTFSYDHYCDYEELTFRLKTLNQKYPEFTRLSELAKTKEGRSIWAMEVTDLSCGDFMDKPAQHIDGNTHAGEVTGSMVALHTLDVLLSNHEEPRIKELLEKFTFTFIPRISPDGAEVYLKTPYSLRSINRSYPDEIQQPGLKEEDVDGDGVIRMMRIANPNGAYKKCKQDERLMVKRRPDEMEGEFYDLYPEGILEGKLTDPIEMAPPLWSIDFNRNYPCYWLPTQRGAGDYPLDNVETKAVADFLIAHQNVGVMVTHHTSGGMILNPPGPWSEKQHNQADIRIYHEMGEIGEETTGYPLLNLYDGFHCTPVDYAAGAGDDWAYLNRGIFAVTVELWDMMARAGVPIEDTLNPSLSRKQQEENMLKGLKWIDEHCPESWKNWEEFDHPQLKKVEIGGLAQKFVVQNCPTEYLNAECEKVTEFTLRQAMMLPRLAWVSAKSEKLGDDLVKIEAELMNLGYLSTSISNQRKTLKLNKGISVTLSGAEVIESEAETWLDELEGYAQDHRYVSLSRVSFSKEAKRKKKLSWIVRKGNAQSIVLKAKSLSAGNAEITLVI